MYEYLKSPKDIYEASFARVKEECDLSRFEPKYHNMIIRMIHGTANPDIIADILIKGDPISGVNEYLKMDDSPNILVDCQMVEAGIMKNELPQNCDITCSLIEDRVIEMAHAQNITRSMAQVDYWHELGLIGNSVIIIGNAPTCLFRLLEIMSDIFEKNKHNKSALKKSLPLAIFAFPIGYIGASEAKEALIESQLPLNFITLRGRLGGSAIAASAFNSILMERD